MYASLMKAEKPYVAPFIRDLMKGAKEEEILEASETLRAYLHVLWGIFTRQRGRSEADSLNRTEHDRFGAEGGTTPAI